VHRSFATESFTIVEVVVLSTCFMEFIVCQFNLFSCSKLASCVCRICRLIFTIVRSWHSRSLYSLVLAFYFHALLCVTSCWKP